MPLTQSVPRENQSLSKSKARRLGSRTVLLGAVAMLTAAGSFGAAQVIPFSSAKAESPIVTTQGFPSFANVIERVRGAVVSVKVIIADASDSGYQPGPAGSPIPPMQPGDPLEHFFRQFGDRAPSFRGAPRGRVQRAQGSGFVISADGYVVTNNHVVKNARKVQLTFEGGRTVDAHVVGIDEKTDLALLKINDAGTYKFVSFAKALPRVGDWVVAIGNPFGLGGTVTAGIVSARGRDIGSGPYDDYLQIDAPVNRGNSGGPTFNGRGEVVGVNTAIYSPSGGSVGIGFAIPSNVAQNVVTSLRDKGTVSRGFMGIQIQPVTHEIAESLGIKNEVGALIADVSPGLPAARAGLQSGDVIVSVNNEAIDTPRTLSRRVANIAPGSKVKIQYIRKGQEQTVELTLASLPGTERAAIQKPTGLKPSATTERFGMRLAPAHEVAGAGKAGLVVAQLDPSGLAARQGLRSGDVIVEAAGLPVSSPSDFSQIVGKARGNGRKAILLRVKSGSSTRFVALGFKNRDAG